MTTLAQTANSESAVIAHNTSWRWPVTAALLLVVAAFALYQVYLTTYSPKDFHGNDIFYIWSDGNNIAHGINPYAKIDNSDMLHNHKYSTYFPGFFVIVSATILAGVKSFDQFMSFWRPMEIPISLTIGLLIFLAARPTKSLALATFGSAFWLFNRWSVNIVRSGQIDSFALMFLVISLLLWDRHKTGSLIVYGLSLSIKQIGIFALPIYLALLWDHSKPLKENFRATIHHLSLIALFPVIFSFPFLVWDPKSFVMSVFFSATRIPGGHINGADSIDALLGFVGLFAKVPMFGLMFLVYILAFNNRIGKYLACLLVFMAFFCFNSVLFKQYIVWFVPFVPLATIEYLLLRPAKLLQRQS
jgi:hypothetical protein